MKCPSDDPEPAYDHSYIINDHIHDHGMKFGSKPPRGLSSSDIILMGEKVTSENDFYMNELSNGKSDYDAGKVEKYRHGLRLGSNYLFMDLHVGSFKYTSAKQMAANADPWDPEPVATAQ
jgi:prepilin-type processing-associated H-X9-DG protein